MEISREIFKLPKIPECKISNNGKSTPEQQILLKIQSGETITRKEVEILDCAYKFYNEAFWGLRSVNLSLVSEEESKRLVQYLKDVINIELILQNEVKPGDVFRMTLVGDYNMKNGKVRDSKYLSYPPIEVVKSRKKLGRANTAESTCLYLAQNPQAAVYECKPSEGDRIIISRWQSIENKPLIMYPVNYSQNTNSGVVNTTNSLDSHLSNSNFYFARMIKVIQEFIGYEFTKDIEIINDHQYEYLYSAYFADKVLNSEITYEDDHQNLLF